MIEGVTHTSKYSIHFSICTRDEGNRRLWLEVVTHEPHIPTYKKLFTGNEYGKALDYYKKKQVELKAEYGE